MNLQSSQYHTVCTGIKLRFDPPPAVDYQIVMTTTS